MKPDSPNEAAQGGVAMLISLLKVATRIAAPMRDGVADPEGLSVTELRIILALGGEGALAGHDLANLMAMQSMNISRALSTLTDMGLVEPVDDPENRRRRPHQLSAAGRIKFAAMQPEMEQVSTFLFGTLSGKEREVAANLLVRLDERLMEWESRPEGSHVKRA